jgi:hypothetical protein
MVTLTLVSRTTIVALIMAGAILALMLMGGSGKAFAQDLPDDLPLVDNGNFVAWLLAPMKASMLVFIAIFMAGSLVGVIFTYLEYHVFKISFERVGHLLLLLLPLIAVVAVAATLLLHKYNLFLLSLYLVIPLLGAPILYVIYDRLIVGKSDRKQL